MSHRSKELRRQIVESGSPLVNHSLSNVWMGREAEAQKKLSGFPKKVLRSQRGPRGNNSLSWEERNLLLIIEDISCSLSLGDNTNPKGSSDKLTYLLENGIYISGLNYGEFFEEPAPRVEIVAQIPPSISWRALILSRIGGWVLKRFANQPTA